MKADKIIHQNIGGRPSRTELRRRDCAQARPEIWHPAQQDHAAALIPSLILVYTLKISTAIGFSYTHQIDN